jgi:hypothetical protein
LFLFHDQREVLTLEACRAVDDHATQTTAHLWRGWVDAA